MKAATIFQLLIITFMLTLMNFSNVSGCDSASNPHHNIAKEKVSSQHQKRNLHYARNCSVVLRSERATNWGAWLDYFSICPRETFVVGMQLKTDPFQGSDNGSGRTDRTALNGVKFLCGKGHNNIGTPSAKIILQNTVVVLNITNQVQKWGKWGQVLMCRKGHVGVGFQLRVLPPLPQGAGSGFKVDDVATCNVKLFCSDGYVLEGDGRNEWGLWTGKRLCPRGYAICSLKTQVEADQFILIYLLQGFVLDFNNVLESFTRGFHLSFTRRVRYRNKSGFKGRYWNKENFKK